MIFLKYMLNEINLQHIKLKTKKSISSQQILEGIIILLLDVKTKWGLILLSYKL